MNLRTVAIISALAIAPLSLISCGDDNPSTSTSATTVAETTTTEKETTTTEASSSEETTTTVAASFEERLTSLQAGLDSAGGDVCVLARLWAGSQDAVPNNAAEVESIVKFLGNLFTAIADSAPEEQRANGEAIRASGAKLQIDAASVSYEPTKMADAVTFPDDAEGAIKAFTEAAAQSC